MELSDELIEALDMVVYTWSKPGAADSKLNADNAGAHLFDRLEEDYGTADPWQVFCELTEELLARESEVGGVWHCRAAGLGAVYQGTIQTLAAQAARDN